MKDEKYQAFMQSKAKLEEEIEELLIKEREIKNRIAELQEKLDAMSAAHYS